MRRRAICVRALFVMCSLLLATGLLVPVGTASWIASLSVSGSLSTAAQFCPVTADLFITPPELNVKSANGNSVVTVHFLGGLPAGYSSADVTSIRMRMKLADGGYGEHTVWAQPHPANEESGVVKFLRSDVVTLTEGMLGDITFEVSGSSDGCDFAGTDTINVFSPGGGKKANEQQPEQKTTLAPEVQGQETVGNPAAGQDEPEQSEQEGDGTDPVETDPALDESDNVGQEEPGTEPVKSDPPKTDPEETEQDDSDSEPKKTNPPGDKTKNDDPQDDGATKPKETDPAADEPEQVEQDEPATKPVKTKPPKSAPNTVEQDEPDVPAEESIEDDPQVDEGEDAGQDVPIIEPIEPYDPPADKPEKAGRDEIDVIPVAGRSQAEDPQPVDEEEPGGAEPEQPEVLPPVENEPEEPEEIVVPCPIVAGMSIMPEELDVAGGGGETWVAVRLPGDLPEGYAIGDVALVTMWVKLGEDQYGPLKVEGGPDLIMPQPGVFEFTQEQMVYLLDDRRGEVTLEVRGVVNGCEFVGTDTLNVIETVVEEPTEPVSEEPQEISEETGLGEEPVDTGAGQDDSQEQPQNVQGEPGQAPENEPGQTTENEQHDSPTDGDEATKPEAEDGESEKPDGTE